MDFGWPTSGLSRIAGIMWFKTSRPRSWQYRTWYLDHLCFLKPAAICGHLRPSVANWDCLGENVEIWNTWHMFIGLQEYKQSNSTEWLRMTKKPQGKEEAVRPPLRCHWKRIRLRLSTCHLRIQNSDVSNRTCIACIALYSIVGLQLPIASHSILQSINVHCILLIFYWFLLYHYIQIIQFIPYQPFHSFPHLAPSSYVVVEVEEASHRLHGSVWLYKWLKNSFPPRKCV